MSVESLSKYLGSIYGNKKASTEHRTVQKSKSINENSQSEFSYTLENILNEFGIYAGNVTYADSFAKFYLPTSSPAATSTDLPLIARPIVGGSYPVNLLDNYGFETGTTAPGRSWTKSGTGTDSFDTDIKSGSEGTRSLAMTWTSATDNYQDINGITCWGQTLRVTLESKTNSGGAASAWKITVATYDGSGNFIGNILDTSNQGTANSTWTNYSFTSTEIVPAGTYSIRFMIRGNAVASTTSKWDNIRLFTYPSTQLPLFFGQDTLGKESYQVGSIRAFDLFNRTSSSELGQSTDFRNWLPVTGTFKTDLTFNGKNEIQYYATTTASSGSDDFSVFEVGESRNLMAYCVFKLVSGTPAPGIIVRYTSTSDYLFVRLNNAGGASTTLRVTQNNVTTALGSESSTFTTANGNTYMIVVSLASDGGINAWLIGSDQNTIPTASYTGDTTKTGTKFGIGTRSGVGTVNFLQFAVADAYWSGSSSILCESLFEENVVKSSSASSQNVYIDLKGPPSVMLHKVNIDTLPTSSDEVGILFNYKDASNFWKFYTTSSAYKITRTVNGIETTNLVTDAKVPSATNHYVQTDSNGFSVITSDTYFDEVMKDTPLGYYRLGESSGTSVKDYSGYGATGAITGSVSFGNTGGVQTDGNTSILVNTTVTTSKRIASAVANLPGGALNRTLEAWIKPNSNTSLTADGGVCGYPYNNVNDTNIFQIACNQVASNLRFRVHYTTATFLNGTTALSTSNWYHVVATYDGSNVRLYVNGTLEATASSITLNTTINPSGSTFNIMGNVVQSSPQRDCYIQDVAVYDKCLSAGRIQAHYNAGISHILLINGKTRYDDKFLNNRTGFGLYFKGTSPRLKNILVSHLDIDPTYKDFGLYSTDKRLV